MQNEYAEPIKSGRSSIIVLCVIQQSAKKMEIMEDGNLVDRVRILLQRDMQYYQVSISWYKFICH